ncbi:uncharacterized protein LOC126265279 [Aethina tumida]|uniref:uncharacterized protein LOC126265279 n=1 Tax=Aethina tumida TaxID=116153 RepID=UPI00214788FB|nr:uncharacterized protein LOC126265279 [Aethina tumida]
MYWSSKVLLMFNMSFCKILAFIILASQQVNSQHADRDKLKQLMKLNEKQFNQNGIEAFLLDDSINMDVDYDYENEYDQRVEPFPFFNSKRGSSNSEACVEELVPFTSNFTYSQIACVPRRSGRIMHRKKCKPFIAKMVLLNKVNCHKEVIKMMAGCDRSNEFR